MKIEWAMLRKKLLCSLYQFFFFHIFSFFPLKEKDEFYFFIVTDVACIHEWDWNSAAVCVKAVELIYVNFNEVRSHDTYLKCWMIVTVFGKKNTFHLLAITIHERRFAMRKQHRNRSYCDKKPRYSNRPTNDHICHTFFYELIVTLLTARHLTRFSAKDLLWDAQRQEIGPRTSVSTCRRWHGK